MARTKKDLSEPCLCRPKRATSSKAPATRLATHRISRASAYKLRGSVVKNLSHRDEAKLTKFQSYTQLVAPNTLAFLAS